MSCDARIRPFVGDREVACEVEGEHALVAGQEQHVGAVRDLAHPGSETTITWLEGDRRNYHGEWPGRCGAGWATEGCPLPVGHRGEHAA